MCSLYTHDFVREWLRLNKNDSTDVACWFMFTRPPFLQCGIDVQSWYFTPLWKRGTFHLQTQENSFEKQSCNVFIDLKSINILFSLTDILELLNLVPWMLKNVFHSHWQLLHSLKSPMTGAYKCLLVVYEFSQIRAVRKSGCKEHDDFARSPLFRDQIERLQMVCNLKISRCTKC